MARNNVGHNRVENFKSRLDGEDAENFLISTMRVVVSIYVLYFFHARDDRFRFFCSGGLTAISYVGAWVNRLLLSLYYLPCGIPLEEYMNEINGSRKGVSAENLPCPRE